MTRILIAPNKYVQGSGATGEIGQHASPLGGRALVTGGKRALGATREAMESSLGAAGISTLVEVFGGECTQTEIRRLATLCSGQDIDLIIAHGEGTYAADKNEIEAINHTFKNNIENINVYSSKGSLGHMLAGSPAVDVILGIYILENV